MNLFEALDYRPAKPIFSIQGMISAVMRDILYKPQKMAAIVVKNSWSATFMLDAIIKAHVDELAKSSMHLAALPGIVKHNKQLIEFDNGSTVRIGLTSTSFRGLSLHMVAADDALSLDTKIALVFELDPTLNRNGGKIIYFS